MPGAQSDDGEIPYNGIYMKPGGLDKYVHYSVYNIHEFQVRVHHSYTVHRVHHSYADFAVEYGVRTQQTKSATRKHCVTVRSIGIGFHGISSCTECVATLITKVVKRFFLQKGAGASC